jgi:hypothetical protein
MAIHALSKEEFDGFKAPPVPVAHFTSREVEWFADHDSTVIGVITRGTSDRDWSVTVFRRDTHGTIRTCEREAGLQHPDDARRLLFARMEPDSNSSLRSGSPLMP